jgi:hypothetical protein
MKKFFLILLAVAGFSLLVPNTAIATEPEAIVRRISFLQREEVTPEIRGTSSINVTIGEQLPPSIEPPASEGWIFNGYFRNGVMWFDQYGYRVHEAPITVEDLPQDTNIVWGRWQRAPLTADDLGNPEVTQTDSYVPFSNWVVQATNLVWGLLGNDLRNQNNGTVGIRDFDAFVNNWEPLIAVFRAFAYGLVILLFGVNVIETSLQYELFTAKGAVKTFGRLLLAKIWVDLSVTICLLIIGVANELLAQIAITTQTFDMPTAVNVSSGFNGDGGIFSRVLATIMNFIMGILLIIPLVLMVLTALIVAICIWVKLAIRSFQIALLLIVSPLFFACWVGDATKQYFKKFITTFIGVVFNIIFMAIVHVIGMEWLAQAATLDANFGVWDWILSGLPWFITMIAMGIMMVKPPKLLTSIVS